jgi:Uncharacterized conserved protein
VSTSSLAAAPSGSKASVSSCRSNRATKSSTKPTLQGLIGSVQDTQADHGLIVSWRGFTAPVARRLNELFFRVRLWGRDDLIDNLFAVYDRLPEDIRAELPLRKTWTLVLDEEEAT